METTGRQLVSLNQTPDVNFFLCRRCRTHIALAQELVYSNRQFHLGIFEAVVNVRLEGPEFYFRLGNITLAGAFCSRCNIHFGWKMIVVRSYSDLFVPGRFILLLDDLLKWDGTRMLYATEPLW